MKKKTLALIALLFLLMGCNQQVKITEKNIDEYTIIVPELEKDYRFLFLADTHIMALQDNLSTEEEKQIYDHTKQRIEEMSINNSQVSFQQWIAYANDEGMDGLLLGGDIIDTPSPATIHYLDTSLLQLQIPYVYSMGNHDWTFPWEYMTEKGMTEYRTQLAPYMNENPAIHMQEFQDLIVVAVDNSTNQFSGEVLEPYKEILEMGKPVILLLHVPLMTQSLLGEANEVWNSPVVIGAGNFGGIYPNDTSTEFIELTTAQNSPVVLVLAGHVHFPNMDYIDGEKRIPQIVSDAGFKDKGTIINIKNNS